MDWIELAQVRDRWRALVNAVMKLRAPYNAGNILTGLEPVSFSRRILLHVEPALEFVDIVQISSKSDKNYRHCVKT
jgi:hypothetical protein